MINVNNGKEYGIRYLPDIYFCDADDNVLYLSRTLKKLQFGVIPEKNIFTLEIVDCVGALEDWSELQKNILNNTITKIYLRTIQRSKDNGEDEPCCLLIPNIELYSANCSFNTEGEIFNFPIVCSFYQPMRKVSVDACPDCLIDNNNLYLVNKGIKTYLKRFQN